MAAARTLFVTRLDEASLAAIQACRASTPNCWRPRRRALEAVQHRSLAAGRMPSRWPREPGETGTLREHLSCPRGARSPTGGFMQAGDPSTPPEGWTAVYGLLEWTTTVAGYAARGDAVKGRCHLRDCRRTCQIDMARLVEGGSGGCRSRRSSDGCDAAGRRDARWNGSRSGRSAFGSTGCWAGRT